MIFKAKLRKIGNSVGVIIPLKVITDYTLGEEIELDVITKEEKGVITKQEVITKKQGDVITKPFNAEMCKKHLGSFKGTCGCG